MKQTAPEAILDHYKVTMRSDDTICVITCKYCLRQFDPVDAGGRRNWIGPMTHTMKHVNEVLRRRSQAGAEK
jgi:hypothetical protein